MATVPVRVLCASEVPKGRGGRGRVVVVDNDPELLDLLSVDLQLEGWEVVAAVRDGLAAVTACLTMRPDVLVADFRMPLGLNGLEVIRRVRRDVPAVRAVLYTNYRAPGLAEEVERLGATYLLKGELATLRAALNRQ